MASLERQDIISDDALKAPQILSDNLQVLLQSLDQVRASAQKYSDGLGSAPLPKLKQDVEGLTQAQVEQNKIQNEIAKTVAKNNELYIAYAQQLKNAKDELKNSQATADSFTKSTTAQNSSIVQLTDALNKNRVAYSNLRSEAERHSKSGQDLLKVIQTQDKSLKELSSSMGQNQARVGGYREEIEKLVPALRSISPEAAEAGEAATGLGTKLLAIVASPITLGLAVLAAGFFLIKESLSAFFERSAEGEDAAKRFSSIWIATTEVLKDKFASLGKSISEAFGLDDPQKFSGMQQALLGYLGFSKIAADLAKKQAEVNIMTEAEIALRKDEIKLTTEIAELELRKNKDLFDAREKLEHSDEQRLKAAFDAREAIKEEIRLKLQSNDLELIAAREQIRISGNSYEAQQKLADIQAKRLQILQEEFQGQRRLQQIIVQTSREIVARQIELEKEHTDAVLKNAETILQANIDEQQRIVGNQEYSIEQQITAQTELTEDKIKLINLGAQKEIEALRTTLKQKEAESQNDFAHLLELDDAFVAQQTAILAKAQEDQLKLLKDSSVKKGEILIAAHNHIIQIDKTLNDEDTERDLVVLEERFAAGEISLLQYNVQKVKIQRAGNIHALDDQIKDYQAELDALKLYQATHLKLDQKFDDELTKAQEKLDKAKLDRAKLANEEDLELQKQLHDAKVKLQQQLFVSTLAVGDNLFAAQQQQANDRIQALNDEKDKELTLAGDNADGKAKIEKDYNAKIAAEQKKIKQLQHNQAIYDRDIAAFEIVVNTAEAIGKAIGTFGYAGIPLSIILAAIGAAQEAIVLSKPIPSYEIGTTNHPGGPARVAEKGSELVIENGTPKLYDVPNTVIPNLAAGSMVFTADETQAIERQLLGNAFRDKIQHDGPPITILDDSRIVAAIDRNGAPDIVGQFAEIYKVEKTREGNRRWKRIKTMGYE